MYMKMSIDKIGMKNGILVEKFKYIYVFTIYHGIFNSNRR